jgi:hypothetical protein
MFNLQCLRCFYGLFGIRPLTAPHFHGIPAEPSMELMINIGGKRGLPRRSMVIQPRKSRALREVFKSLTAQPFTKH